MVTLRAWPAPGPELIPGDRAFPILSLETDPANIWSYDTGIYVWGVADPNWDQRGSERERTTHLNLWNPNPGARQFGIRFRSGQAQHVTGKIGVVR